MEYRTAYIVEYARMSNVYGTYLDNIKEYWSIETLSNRLKVFEYCIFSAVMTVVENPDIVIIDEEMKLES